MCIYVCMCMYCRWATMDCSISLPYACAVGTAGDRAPTWAVDLDILGGWEKSSCGFRYVFIYVLCMYVCICIGTKY